MLEELKQLKTWVVHKNKHPYSTLTGMPTGVDGKHSGEWVTYDEARAYLDKRKSAEGKKDKKFAGDKSTEKAKESEPTMTGARSVDNAVSTGSRTGSSADNSFSDFSGFNGLGFVIPKGYFFLDIDHNDATSPLAKEIMALLPTYAEISHSGTGVHLYGKCDFTRLPTHVINSNNGKIPRTKLAAKYYVKNANAGLELYIGDLTERFSTFTGLAVSKADDAVDCTKELLTFLDRYMLRRKGNNQATSNNAGNKGYNTANNSASGNSDNSDNNISWNSEAAEAANDAYNWNWGGNKASGFNSKPAFGGRVTDFDDNDQGDQGDQEEPSNNVIELSVWNLIPNEERYITLTEDDIPTVIADLHKQANAAKFKALYEQGRIEEKSSHSEADASLCSMIAFRVGPNSPEIIDAIFRRSALYRDKWDRKDYAERTISLAIEACQGNFHPALKRQPPFVLSNGKGKYSIEANRLAEYVRNHLNFLIVREEGQENALIFIYRDGCYRRSSNATFETTIQSFITAYDKYLVRNNVIQDAIKVLLRSEIILSNDALNTNENYINVKNGLLNLQTLELHPHTPKLYSTIQIPVVWTGQETPTPMFDKYMGDLCKGRPDVYRFLLEFIGACCSNVQGYSFKKALFLYGAGDTGKSQLRTLVERLLGSKNSVALFRSA